MPTQCQRVTLCSDLFGRGALLVHSHVAQHGWDPRQASSLTRCAHQHEYPMARTKGPLIRVTLQLYLGEGALHVLPLCAPLPCTYCGAVVPCIRSLRRMRQRTRRPCLRRTLWWPT